MVRKFDRNQRMSKRMKTTMFKSKIFTAAAILGTAGAIALCSQQAFALGGMGGAVGAHVGAMNVGMGSGASRAGATGMAGSVTMNGITVLPNGSLVVPAVTARVPKASTPSLNGIDDQMTEAPCRTAASCDGY
jgi:hypothetical protein